MPSSSPSLLVGNGSSSTSRSSLTQLPTGTPNFNSTSSTSASSAAVNTSSSSLSSSWIPLGASTPSSTSAYVSSNSQFSFTAPYNTQGGSRGPTASPHLAASPEPSSSSTSTAAAASTAQTTAQTTSLSSVPHYFNCMQYDADEDILALSIGYVTIITSSCSHRMFGLHTFYITWVLMCSKVLLIECMSS